jgi:predicted RNase H-like nuclease (RuvC/YqgF family)
MFSAQLNSLQVKVSKINASNQKSGVSAEMEELRAKFIEAEDQKNALQRKLDEFEIKAQADDEKKRKVMMRPKPFRIFY